MLKENVLVSLSSEKPRIESLLSSSYNLSTYTFIYYHNSSIMFFLYLPITFPACNIHNPDNRFCSLFLGRLLFLRHLGRGGTRFYLRALRITNIFFFESALSSLWNLTSILSLVLCLVLSKFFPVVDPKISLVLLFASLLLFSSIKDLKIMKKYICDLSSLYLGGPNHTSFPVWCGV